MPCAATPTRRAKRGLDGLLEELDGYSRYSGRDEARDNRANREGFGGIGVRIRLVEEGVRVIMVMDETPAQVGGLLAQDLITHIDGESVLNMNQREVVRRLRGPVNSSVSLEVARGEVEPLFLNFDIKRSHIVPQTVRYSRDGNRAYIRISGFNQSTTRSLRDALVQAEEEIGPALSGYILDLRGNPGGLLDQAVTVSDLFLSNGRIVSTHGRHPDSHQYFDAAPETLAHQRPVVVLVNGNSASASEIVAAALQDTGRAVVIGTSSFGKGSVQTVLRLPNNGELTLTWARFHAPSGYSLHGRGVMPDICTSGQEETPEQVIARLQSGQLPLSRKITRRIVDTNDRTELTALRSLCPARHADAEVDLDVARRLLDSPGLFALARGFDDLETANDNKVQTSAVETAD
jgi:carboxyl-terminal processing protease